MKKYEPKQMVASSRYQNYFPTLPAQIQQDVYSRMNDLLMKKIVPFGFKRGMKDV